MGVVDCLWTIEILSWGDGAIPEEEKKDGLFDTPSIEKGDICTFNLYIIRICTLLMSYSIEKGDICTFNLL